MMLSLLRSLAGGTLGRRLYSSAHFEQRCGDHLVSNGMIRIRAAVCPFTQERTSRRQIIAR
jgi:adenylylsulfate kinase-like enzyme